MMHYYNYWKDSLRTLKKFTKNDNFKIDNCGFCFISNCMFQENNQLNVFSHAEVSKS